MPPVLQKGLTNQSAMVQSPGSRAVKGAQQQWPHRNQPAFEASLLPFDRDAGNAPSQPPPWHGSAFDYIRHPSRASGNLMVANAEREPSGIAFDEASQSSRRRLESGQGASLTSADEQTGALGSERIWSVPDSEPLDRSQLGAESSDLSTQMSVDGLVGGQQRRPSKTCHPCISNT